MFPVRTAPVPQGLVVGLAPLLLVLLSGLRAQLSRSQNELTLSPAVRPAGRPVAGPGLGSLLTSGPSGPLPIVHPILNFSSSALTPFSFLVLVFRVLPFYSTGQSPFIRQPA